jgi:hypothetical protein
MHPDCPIRRSPSALQVNRSDWRVQCISSSSLNLFYRRLRFRCMNFHARVLLLSALNNYRFKK